MINGILEDLFDKTKRPGRKHTDRFYPTQSSVYIRHDKYKKLEGKCLRAAYYNCLGIKEQEESPLKMNLIFKMGDYTESMLLDLIDRNGALVESDVKFFEEKYCISGRLDAIVKCDNKEYGLEIKSIGSNKWTYNAIWGSRWNTAFPKWQNLLQSLVYCYVFRDRIDEFILFYIRRDTCETKEFRISIQPKDDKMYACIDGKIDERFCIEDILERYAALMEHVNLRSLPDKDFSKLYPSSQISKYVKLGILSKWQGSKYKEQPFGDFECKYCGYSDLCDKDYTGEDIENDTLSTENS